MLKKRLIPKLQLKTANYGTLKRMVLVTTEKFGSFIEVGDPVSQAKIYQAQAADELIFLNIRPLDEERELFLKIIRKVSEEVFMPVTVGGGVRTIEEFRILLASGADKISVNSAAVETPSLIDQASRLFGAQCVVLSIDYKKDAHGNYSVWSRGGTLDTGLDPVEWAKEGFKRGAGEILITSIDRDGSKSGLDLEMTSRISQSVPVPVISSGGCGLASHFTEGFLEGKADAISAGTYFCFKDQNPMQTRAHIKNAGIPIRLHQ